MLPTLLAARFLPEREPINASPRGDRSLAGYEQSGREVSQSWGSCVWPAGVTIDLVNEPMGEELQCLGLARLCGCQKSTLRLVSRFGEWLTVKLWAFLTDVITGARSNMRGVVYMMLESAVRGAGRPELHRRQSCNDPQ